MQLKEKIDYTIMIIDDQLDWFKMWVKFLLNGILLVGITLPITLYLKVKEGWDLDFLTTSLGFLGVFLINMLFYFLVRWWELPILKRTVLKLETSDFVMEELITKILEVVSHEAFIESKNNSRITKIMNKIVRNSENFLLFSVTSVCLVLLVNTLIYPYWNAIFFVLIIVISYPSGYMSRRRLEITSKSIELFGSCLSSIDSKITKSSP